MLTGVYLYAKLAKFNNKKPNLVSNSQMYSEVTAYEAKQSGGV